MFSGPCKLRKIFTMKSPLYDSHADDDHNPNVGILPKAFTFSPGFCYSS